MPRKQDQVLRLAELPGHPLGEPLPSGVEENDPASHTPKGVDGAEEGLGLEDHPAAAAVRGIIGDPMPPLRAIAKVDDANLNFSPLLRKPKHALVERTPEDSREKRHYINLHSALS
jgi:hypothetical protein